MKKVKVLFIGGAGRSGSTLLDNILGQIHGFTSVGEFNEIWKAGYTHNKLCGCGRPFLDCHFWTSVTNSAFGGISNTDIAKIIELQNNVCRMRKIPRLACSKLQTKTFRRRLMTFCKIYAALLDGISSISGAEVIVDSSKTPAHAYMLSMIDNIDLHVLQLVRDSRAVAFSWGRKKKIQDSRSPNSYMVRMGPVKSSADWNRRHLLLGTLKHVKSRNIKSYTLLRYEDFVDEPKVKLREIVQSLDTKKDINIPFVSDLEITRSQLTHTIEGNPSKHIDGNIKIRSDKSWLVEMTPLNRIIVTTLTAYYLRKFKYI